MPNQISEQERLHKWDLVWLDMARYVGQKMSKDPSTKVGAVIVRNVNDFVSIGYNGFPKRMEDDPALYLNREEKLKRVVHAEINACNTRHGPGPFTLYCSLHPCAPCVGPMANADIRRVVFPAPSEAEIMRWGQKFLDAREQMQACGIEVVIL